MLETLYKFDMEISTKIKGRNSLTKYFRPLFSIQRIVALYLKGPILDLENFSLSLMDMLCAFTRQRARLLCKVVFVIFAFNMEHVE